MSIDYDDYNSSNNSTNGPFKKPKRNLLELFMTILILLVFFSGIVFAFISSSNPKMSVIPSLIYSFGGTFFLAFVFSKLNGYILNKIAKGPNSKTYDATIIKVYNGAGKYDKDADKDKPNSTYTIRIDRYPNVYSTSCSKKIYHKDDHVTIKINPSNPYYCYIVGINQNYLE